MRPTLEEFDRWCVAYAKTNGVPVTHVRVGAAGHEIPADQYRAYLVGKAKQEATR